MTSFHVIKSGRWFVVEKRTGIHAELVLTPTGRPRRWKTSAKARSFIEKGVLVATQAERQLDGRCFSNSRHASRK